LPVNPGDSPDRYTREQLQADMFRGLITEPLLSEIRDNPGRKFHIIIALNESWAAGIDDARETVRKQVAAFNPDRAPGTSSTYVFAQLTGKQILSLAGDYSEWAKKEWADKKKQDKKARLTEAARPETWSQPRKGPIYRIWKDEEVRACLTESTVTVKADAAHRAFNAVGEGITWAVLDSGIDKHKHFEKHGNLVTDRWSKDFVGDDPFDDPFGHGTHVAGIIAGAWENTDNNTVAVQEVLTGVDPQDQPTIEVQPLTITSISGVAPRTRLVSMKVLDGAGVGRVSCVLQAISAIQEINDFGRRLALPNAAIHGVNMSLGYDFNPRWFGCGQSPICVEVNRLVRSGVVVVVSAGNSGFSALSLTASGGNELGYRDASVNDPGNAEFAITVGSTHRDRPHTYGVSYFSSRGPTGDGRLKPDLVAPGERIISCAAGTFKTAIETRVPANTNLLYLEQSGTSMAAPHVSGAIAAFLSVRREFIGQPERVKELFLENAIDLKRERAYQGHGLLDLMKVLQAI
jgi:subtilisin family serine protease